MPDKKILVVDDDELVLIAVSELLLARGFDVATASSGPKALDVLEKQRFDLAIFDVIMPEMSGLELCARVREMEAGQDLPIIMLTAKSADEDREAGIAAGATLYLPKPIAPNRLIQLVQEALKG